MEEELFASKHFVIVLEEGYPAGYFEGEDTRRNGNEELENSNSNTNVNAEAGGEIFDDSIFHPTWSQTKDIALARNQELDADNNN